MQPFPWQEPAVEAMASALSSGRSFLNASDTGTGKTPTALWAIQKTGLPFRVVCPKSVVQSWRETAEKLGIADRMQFVQNIEKLRRNKEVLVPLGANFLWKRSSEKIVTVFDEVHRFSAYNSQNAVILSRCPRPALMLSATAADSPVKLRAIGQHLGLCAWDEWPQWAAKRGCSLAPMGGYQFSGHKSEIDRLHQEIFDAGRGCRIRIADLGDQFPENSIETMGVEVEEGAEKAINRAYAEEIEQLKGEAPSPAVDMLRARQLAEHAKLPALLQLVEDEIEGGRSAVVFVNFRESLAQLVEKFDCPAIYGQQDTEERELMVKSFEEDRKFVIGVMIQAGGCGLDGLQDLHGGRPRSSFICPGWSAIDLRQALGRIHRGNAKSRSLQKLVFAAGTIEDSVRRKLNGKLRRIDLLNDGDLAFTQ